MQNILEIRDLGRSYVNFRLEHISLSIPGGARTAPEKVPPSVRRWDSSGRMPARCCTAANR